MSFFKASSLVRSFEESQTLLLSARAKKLAAEGRSIINFGGGELDFNTPSEIIDRAYEAAKKGQTKYTAVSGLPSLRKAIARRISEDYGVGAHEEEILASCGGKQAIYHFLQAVVEPGDEVIILAPYWVSFPEMVKMVGGKPIIVRAKGERITPEEVAAVVSDRTKVLILNSPSNPSGTVLTEDEIKGFMESIASKAAWILSDDTYYRLVYAPARFISPLQIDSDWRKRVCVIGSSSKSYAMTGWRLGWAFGPKELILAMTKLQSQVTSSPASPSQAAAEAALLEFDGVAEDFRTRLIKRRDLMVKALKDIPKVSYLKPDGAFYVFANISGHFAGGSAGPSVTSFCSQLLEEHGVCVIPGVAFGDERFIRLSYSLSEEHISEGIRRIRHALLPK